jgi:ABC-type lipoprotein export system ATPase subunit
MSEPRDDILVAEGLCKTYTLGKRDVEVLQGIDLQVRRGEVLVIAGASGAGKSTLLHLLGGLDAPSSGDVTLDGASLFKMSNAELTRLRNQRIGFVFQSYNLLPELDALENVCLPAMLSAQRRENWVETGIELLKAVGLAERMEHRPAELSGGEQQRVAIARALMNRPSLLLADEPTGNLDSKTSEAILDLLWQMHTELKTTMVMVTHDEHIARRGERVLQTERLWDRRTRIFFPVVFTEGNRPSRWERRDAAPKATRRASRAGASECNTGRKELRFLRYLLFNSAGRSRTTQPDSWLVRFDLAASTPTAPSGCGRSATARWSPRRCRGSWLLCHRSPVPRYSR